MGRVRDAALGAVLAGALYGAMLCGAMLCGAMLCTAGRAEAQAELAGEDGSTEQRAEEESYVRRWSVRALAGAGGQTSTGTVGGILYVEGFAHPFLGALGIGLSISALYAGDKFLVASAGFSLELDIAYLVASGLWSSGAVRDPGLGVSLGARLGMSYGRVQHEVPWAMDTSVFDVFRPEWTFYVDVDVPIGDLAVITVRPLALDAPVDLANVARWSVAVGAGVAWGRGP